MSSNWVSDDDRFKFLSFFSIGDGHGGGEQTDDRASVNAHRHVCGDCDVRWNAKAQITCRRGEADLKRGRDDAR